MSNQKSKQSRRRFSDEYKAKVVDLILSSDKSLREVCQDLDLTDSAVRRWVKVAEEKRLKQPASDDGESEAEELKRLRAEVRIIKAERDILKKATAFFAKDSM